MNMDYVTRRMIVRAMFACTVLLSALPLARGDVDPFSEANRQKPATADRIEFKGEISPKEVKPGDLITLTITGTPGKGFHTYPLTKKAKGQSESQLPSIRYLDTSVFTPLYPISETEPVPHAYVELDELLLEHAKQFTWTQQFLVQNSKPGKKYLSLAIHVQVCDDKTCLNGIHYLDVPVVIDEGPPLGTVPPAIKERLAKPPVVDVEMSGLPGDLERSISTIVEIDRARAAKQAVSKSPDHTVAGQATPQGAAPPADTDLLTFLGLAVVWGALSLVTPCVFPMIPITVSFFIKQSEAKKSSPLFLALVYSGTIAAVLTIAGVFLIQILQPFSQHYLTNFAIGVLFIVFALSLFGMYEIVLPARLVNLTSSQEGRGGVVGTMFMALTFSIISFTCVAPFYGGFIGIASSSQGGAWWSNPNVMLKLGLGAMAYSVTFASPFFFLALFPSLMQALPKSGSWMNTVKVVMGFLELAAALKLLRASELSLVGKTDFLTYDVVLGLYVALSVACSLYLLNLHRPWEAIWRIAPGRGQRSPRRRFGPVPQQLDPPRSIPLPDSFAP